MDGLMIKLPFQGVNCFVLHIFPRRCHWAELTNGFQPLQILQHDHWAKHRTTSHWNKTPQRSATPCGNKQQTNTRWTESPILFQPNGNALGNCNNGIKSAP